MIILDRDGVINFESDKYIKCPEEWHPIPGSLEAIGRLSKAGFEIVIVTNQAGVGRGLYDEATLAKIHEKLLTLVAEHGGKVEKIYYCPHHPDDKCDCRKPEPGMLKQVADDFDIDWSKSLMIGDSTRDLKAAQAMGCTAWLVKTGYGQGFLDAGEVPEGVPVYANLSAAVDEVLLSREA